MSMNIHEQKQEEKTTENRSEIQRVEDALTKIGTTERLAFLMWGMYLEGKYGKAPFTVEDIEALNILREVAKMAGGTV